ncbi:MAG: potassium-transporting ATPase subunit KdpA [Phycisphaerae bacterium]|nr:potassium-transporting ATPase subunit KdpA [Phycisphaerae bacterium]
MIDEPDRSWRRHSQRALTALVGATALLAACSLAIEYGFKPDRLPVPERILVGLQIAAVVMFVVRALAGIVFARERLDYLRSRWLEILVIVAGLLALFVEAEVSVRPRTLYILTVQIVLGVELVYHLSWAQVLLAQRHHPARLMVGSFLVVIVIGTFLLSLPRAGTPHRMGPATSTPRHVLNCAFTAVSATCVTGLIVYDTPNEFTLFGQAVILVLMQLGGLGIMVFGTVFGLLLGRRLTLSESVMMQGTLAQEAVGRIGRVLRFVVITTFLLEAAGTVILYNMWDDSIPPGGLRWFHSAFTAVSAFCNAGFSLQSDSMVSYRGAWQLYASVMPLIVLGGLGFPVLSDLFEWVGSHLLGKRRFPTASVIAGRADTLSLHTKLVLLSTGILIVAGAGLLLFFETPSRVNPRYPADLRADRRPQPPVMAGETWPQRTLDSVFQSVTTRTAGFNSVPMTLSAMSPASHFLMMLLMFIGGSPGSTAGGAKTVTVSVILLGVVSVMRRREAVEFAGRTIPMDLVRRAGVLLILMFGLVSLTTLLLTFSESENARFQEILFEAISACGTVGLSCGITSELTAFGRFVIMAAMFVGRLGPLTLLLALAGRERPSRYGFPEEGVIIG